MRRRVLATSIDSSDAAHPGSVSWFVFALVGGSAITLIQLMTVGAELPVTLALQGALAFQAFLLLTRRPFRVATSDGVVPAVWVMLLGAFTVLIHALLVQSPDDQLRTSFLFMYSIGLALVVYLAGPATLRLTVPLVALIGVALALGLAQSLADDLLLPDSFKQHYGIVYERFVNGRVRALSFFTSAPRFAELIVFTSVYVLFSIMQRADRRVPRVALALALLFMLYNTFSRSGYVFFITAVFFLLVQGHARLSTRSDGTPAISYYLTMLTLIVGGLYIAFSSTLDESGVTDRTSLDARLSHWESLKTQFDANGLNAYVFGTGRSAHANFLQADYFVVDNVFYAFAFFGGIVGLLTVGWLYWRTLRALLRARSRHPELIPLVALLSALPIEGLFLDNHNTLLLAIFVAIGVMNRYAQQDPQDIESIRTQPLADRSNVSGGRRAQPPRVKGLAGRAPNV